MRSSSSACVCVYVRVCARAHVYTDGAVERGDDEEQQQRLRPGDDAAEQGSDEDLEARKPPECSHHSEDPARKRGREGARVRGKERERGADRGGERKRGRQRV